MRRMVLAVAVLSVQVFLSGCAETYDSTDKLEDPDYQIMNEEDAPDELGEMINRAREEPFQITYADQGKLFIAEGYGRKSTSGYSVAVKELYETEDAIHVRTNLLGPQKKEEIRDAATYPCVIVQLEYVEKEVLFD